MENIIQLMLPVLALSLLSTLPVLVLGQPLSGVVLFWKAVWRYRLRRSPKRAHWAFVRLTGARPLIECFLSAFVLMLGLLVLTATLADVLPFDPRWTLVIGIWLGCWNLLEALLYLGLVAHTRQDAAYREAFQLIPEMKPEEAKLALELAMMMEKGPLPNLLLHMTTQQGVDVSHALIKTALKTPDLKEEVRLLRHVFAHTPDRLLPYIRHLLASEAAETRGIAMHLLPKLPAQQRQDIETDLLNSRDDTKREQYLDILASQPELTDDAQLEQLLNSGWPKLRLAAARILQQRRQPDWIPRLLRQLNREQEAPVQQELLRALLAYQPTPIALLDTGLHFAGSGYAPETNALAAQLLRGYAGQPHAGIIAARMLQLLLQPNLPSAHAAQAAATLDAMGPACLPGLMDAVSDTGMRELLHTLLRELRLPPPAAWPQMAPAEAATAWSVLMVRLRQESTNRRAQELIANLRSTQYETQAAALAELKISPSVRYLPELEAFLKSTATARSNRKAPYLFAHLTESEVQLLAEMGQMAAKSCLAAQAPAVHATANRGFCQQCRCRSQTAYFLTRSYVHCPRCLNDAQLLPFVREVVGRIGGALPTATAEVQYLSVWDETQKTAQPAEMDVLELAPDTSVTHDWALTALLEAQEQAGFSVAHLHVRLLGNLELSINSARMLKEAGISSLSQPNPPTL